MIAPGRLSVRLAGVEGGREYSKGVAMELFEAYKQAIRWAQKHIDDDTTVEQIDREQLAWAFRALFYVNAADDIPPPAEQFTQIHQKLLQRGPLEE